MTPNLDAASPLIGEFRQFIDRNWVSTGNTRGWQRALCAKGWLGADWPASEDGPGWDTGVQWMWASACAAADCPLPSDEFGILAPLLLGVGTGTQKEHLTGIKAGHAWQFHFSTRGLTFDGSCLDGTLAYDPSRNLCLLVDDQLLLLTAASLRQQKQDKRVLRFTRYPVKPEERLGTGEGTKHLALNQSALCNLTTLLTALVRLRHLLHEGDPPRERLTELEIAAKACEGMFLQGRSYPALSLRLAEIKVDIINLLGDAMGYYRLLETAPGETDNEPALPFAAEKALLMTLQRSLAIDTRVQKDLLHEHLRNL